MTTAASSSTPYLEHHLPPRSRVGDIALVTGGTKGIGKEVARKLVHAGVTVILGARDREVGEQAAAELTAEGEHGARATFHQLDLADEASIIAMVDYVTGEVGRLDILVNDAARAFPPKSAFDVTAAEMRTVFDVNVFAVITLTAALFPLLDASKAGRIVNVSSERGALGVGDTPTADRMREQAGNIAPVGSVAHRIAFVTAPNMAYGTSKATLNAVTQHFAYQIELAGSRVRINAAAPGHCATPFNNFRGWRTAEEGARIVAALALCGDDAPNGAFLNEEGPTVL